MDTRDRTSPSILIVDDDPIASTMLEAMLLKSGFDVIAAPCVADALEQTRRALPDLVLLDVGLPDGNGFDLCRTIQLMPGMAQSPILFISASDDSATKVRGFEVGGVDYITKPFDGAEVIARVRTHLRLKLASESLVDLQAERVKRLATAQQTIMPAPGRFPEARFAVSLTQVHKAGGDFYDVVPAGNGVFDYLAADASGHDLDASFWTAALKMLVTEHVSPVISPFEAVGFMNHALRRILPMGVFFTLIYARLNRMSGRLSIVNAGNPAAIIVRAQGGDTELIVMDSDVLGAFADAIFPVREIDVAPQDRLFLFSDGLIELEGDRSVGYRRLQSLCAAARTAPIADAVVNVVESMTEGVPVTDDIVFLGTEI